eukprot:scaffold57353_cov15-Tisochrysis_lutea.AAC.2
MLRLLLVPTQTFPCSSSLASYMRMNGPVFQPQQHRLSARERGTRGVSRDKIQLAPLPEQVAAIVQQLQKPPPSVLPTQPFRLPPPSGALGAVQDGACLGNSASFIG